MIINVILKRQYYTLVKLFLNLFSDGCVSSGGTGILPETGEQQRGRCGCVTLQGTGVANKLQCSKLQSGCRI